MGGGDAVWFYCLIIAFGSLFLCSSDLFSVMAFGGMEMVEYTQGTAFSERVSRGTRLALFQAPRFPSFKPLYFSRYTGPGT